MIQKREEDLGFLFKYLVSKIYDNQKHPEIE